jgi:hypothetical protein
MKTLQDIETDVAALARRIGASLHDLPTHGTSRDGGYPHVELHDGLIIMSSWNVARRSSADRVPAIMICFIGYSGMSFTVRHSSMN